MNKYTAYNFGHDEWDASSYALQKCLHSQTMAARYRNPFGFGPSPGPRLPLSLDPSSSEIKALRDSRPELSATYSIRFRSSRTFLQRLLPPGFGFTSPATNVSASIKCTTLDSMTWLGGGGYNHLGLYIHGVNYTKQDGSKVFGTYLPVLFEDLADPIITGRDELGFPKVFADINVSHATETGNSAIILSWRGTQFGEFQIKGLRRAELTTNAANEETAQEAKPGPGSTPPPPEQGQLVYRYVPSVGEPGKTDAEYAVLFPNPPQDTSAETLVADAASIQFEAQDWQKLPTLHHIARTLAAIPIYEFEKVEMIQGTQVNDLSAAVRI